MPNWGVFVARLLSVIGSWLDASNLRNRVYKLEQENEVMRVALEDIQRMGSEGRIAWIAQETLKNVKKYMASQ
jgi:predicted KAP-like P-loop ATPase